MALTQRRLLLLHCLQACARYPATSWGARLLASWEPILWEPGQGEDTPGQGEEGALASRQR